MKQLQLVFFCCFAWLLSFHANAESMRMAVTTSFNNSGLSDILLPELAKDTGLKVELLVVGTGQALKLGRAGDVDAVLVHSRKAEEEFVAEGYAKYRREIMFNDFVVIGPSSDPATVAGSATVNEALRKIADSKSVFVSRGDDSGTHRKEISLWKNAGLEPEAFDPAWYRETGAGMGASLNTASGMNAYLMSDRASWLKFGNKGDLALLFAGDPLLFNQYAYLPIDPARHPHVKYDLATRLESWLVSAKAQEIIGQYRINGETLFTPNASFE